MADNLARRFPCAAFFAAGRVGAGFTALLMQASSVFWTAAARWARLQEERAGLGALLAELSETYRCEPYAGAAKALHPRA